ncbi:MAG: acyl-CoA dehydrogenase family protein [Gammaproteobacteria bacterium]|nr:acyl-CoA dehydrogenase family protein [Gammaproteobacteria bacterium]NND39010.1 acyl-CoA dehydrogenase [Pseudomonadales bacterium]NNL10606.1 acyl-CoA dehydrogenase [Pseudomonadales bacterium]NNM11998.1 acyl-CoA dehydrogenase [Pseudomonadales bacterium]RZV55227.1 MAG: acyl-CoA dehydrogenase [Pseudomonadales bacterium]
MQAERLSHSPADFSIDAEEQAQLALFRDTVRRFCAEQMAPCYAQWESDGLVPRELFNKLGDAGLLCVDVPEAYGGYGVPAQFSFAIVEELGYAGFTGFTGGLQVHNDIVPPYLVSFGTEAQKQRWLPGMVSGEIVTAIGMSEPNAGSDLANIKTSAQRTENGYLINGSKIFISNGQHADMLLLAAKTDKGAGARGTSLFLVDASLPGYSRGSNLAKVGHKCADTSELFFENLLVPHDALLGEEGAGFGMMMEKLARERMIIGVLAVGAARGALDWTIDYVQERQAFGAPLAKLQNTRFKLAEAHTRIMANTSFMQQCFAAYRNGQLTPEVAAAFKLYATEMQCEVIDECLQLFGGYGYMSEYPISRAWADARVQRIYGGTSEIMKEVVARSLVGK